MRRRKTKKKGGKWPFATNEKSFVCIVMSSKREIRSLCFFSSSVVLSQRESGNFWRDVILTRVGCKHSRFGKGRETAGGEKKKRKEEGNGMRGI
jgi:hypothetical protein